MKKFSFLLTIMVSLFLTGCSMPGSPLPSLGKKNVKKEYFTGGKVRSEFIMSDETGLNGVQKTYGYDGHLTSLVKIKNGVKNGVETWFDNKKRILMRVPYANGRKEGVQEVYYPNGDPLRRTTYKNGVLNGKAIMYNKDGSVHKTATFSAGKKIG